MLTKLIQKLMHKKDLTETDCMYLVKSIVKNANSNQIAALLVLLHSKPETSDELYYIVRAMQKHMNSIQLKGSVVDIVGTGGDNANTINISTAAALVAASLGIKVAKHGNRSVSSQCGSADILEALGFPIEQSEEELIQSLKKHNFAFLFSPNFHPATQKIKQVRNNLGVRTTFNLIGPLLNPAQPEHYLIGTYEKSLAEKFANILIKQKTKRSIIVNGRGIDEVTCIGPVDIIEVSLNRKKEYVLDPKEYGFKYCELKDLQGGTAEKNKKLILKAFSGEQSDISNTIALNTAILLYLTGRTQSIDEAILIVTKQLESGRVLEFLSQVNGHE